MSLAHRAVRGTAIILASSYANLVIGFVATIALTRLLSPDVFGLFNLSVVLFSLIDLRNKVGLDFAFVHRQPTTDELAATHWLLHLALATITMLIGFGASWLLPIFGYSQNISRLLIALCIVGVVEALGATARVMLEKELRFGRSTLIVSSALLLANVTAIVLAWRGAGIWSLVAQVGVNALIGSLGFWWITPVRPRLTFSAPLAKWLMRFGLTLTLASLATIVLLNGDNFMVGTFVSVAALGYYERAYKVAQWPTGLVTHVVSRAAMPTYAKLQDDQPRLSKAFGLTLWVITSVATPLALALFVSAPDFILLIFGPEWAPSGILLRFLVGYSVLRPLLDDTGALLTATGRPQRVTQLLAVEAITLVVVALPLTLMFGAVGTAVGVGIAFFVGALLAYHFVAEVVALDWQAAFAPPAIALVSALGLYLLMSRAVDLNVIPLLARILVKSSFVAGIFVAALVLLQRETMARLGYVMRLLRNQ